MTLLLFSKLIHFGGGGADLLGLSVQGSRPSALQGSRMAGFGAGSTDSPTLGPYPPLGASEAPQRGSGLAATVAEGYSSAECGKAPRRKSGSPEPDF